MADGGNINAIREWTRRYFYTKEEINYFMTKLDEGYKGYALMILGPRNAGITLYPNNYHITLNSDGWYRGLFFFGEREQIELRVDDGTIITYQLDAYNDTINVSPYVIATEQMTSTFQPSGYITEKGHWNGSPINVFDRDNSSLWECPGVDSTWICYELPEAKTVYSVKLVTLSLGEGVSIDPVGRPRHFDIQASNDGENWTTIYTQDKRMKGTENTIEFSINDPKPYIYYRFWQYSADMYDDTDPQNPHDLWTPSYTVLKEMYLYTINQDTNTYQIATPIMTSNDSNGCETTASSTNGTSYPYQAFNQQVNWGWVSQYAFNAQTPWIQFRFQEGVRKIIKKLRFWNQSNIKQFVLQGSNDGENFIDLGTFNMRHTEQYYNQIFYVDNSNAYQYYRIAVTDAFTINSDCQIARIDMFEVV